MKERLNQSGYTMVFPDRKEKEAAFHLAERILRAHGLKPSEKADRLAALVCTDTCSFSEAQQQLDKTEESEFASCLEKNSFMADRLFFRAADCLCNDSFSYRSIYLTGLHQTLFEGLLDPTEPFKDRNSYHEVSSTGDTGFCEMDTLAFQKLTEAFEKERQFSYLGLNRDQIISHLADFFSRLWKLHPFLEGCSLTFTILIVQYLQFLGLKIKEEAFLKQSKFLPALWKRESRDRVLIRRNLERFLKSFV